MNATADALRALLRFADNVPTDSQLAARMTDGTTGLAAIVAARAALAAHGAAVAAGGWRVQLTERGRVRIASAHGACIALVASGNDANDLPRASRIVACVNACEGIEDPADLVRALRDCVAALDSVAAPGSLQAAARDAGAAALGGDA